MRCSLFVIVAAATCASDHTCPEEVSLLQLRGVEHGQEIDLNRGHQRDEVASVTADQLLLVRETHLNENVVEGDCTFTGWGDWSSCTTTCGDGYLERRREVVSGPHECST